ncbi:esterase, PHB depolymerase family [Paracoccus alcaliphilus]|uniref:Esterase, PHB depolymerase family n=1 Tax=Paracoccus alcaliphilus TaxID=34002 RepID=A0A1H8LWH7_9RHOB|nr:PHB depolymerase family esterase [Paracoccus alcaliphilus]WCR20598.1 PHB depolymerase family esterase [Paracoccus alcaliphilus]SEO09441.1 esterase, PHB depolymerase family [Paracoccus alcaliphilus]
MKPFDTSALRRVMADARPGAASDLVRRTLAQHGLMAEGGNPAAPNPLAAMAGMLNRQAHPSAAPEVTVPGASFGADRFACKAGARDYLTYVPASASDGATGLIVMLHGCTQTHADFAAGTGMNALAERHGFVTVYPQQSRGDNAQSCWNWFSPGDQRRDRGEPAILAGIATQVAAAHGVPPSKTFVAGLSAGAAMAVILGQTHPDIFAAVGAHSGLPFGSARDVPSAFAVMAGTAESRPTNHRATPTIIFQGSADHTVNPANADRIARDILGAGPELTLFDKQSRQINGRSVVQETTTTGDGATLLEYWKVEGLGHAWSGGNPAGSYTDQTGPDASAEMVRFFLTRG